MSEKEHYQENGFQLVIYRDRRPDPYTTCEACQRPLFHVSTILDQWAEGQLSRVHYHHCKHCNTILQQTIREGPSGTTNRRAVFEQPPHELLVEIVATARQQNGRGVTLLTVNRRWWAPHRYPLTLGSMVEETEITDDLEDEAPVDDPLIPMLRYQPPSSKPRNPFTSRGRAETAHEDDD